MIHYIGVDDTAIDLFEGQYRVPEGISYNAYFIDDAKTCAVDTVDARFTDEWAGKLRAALGGRPLDYLVTHHLEPDHSAGLTLALREWPQCRIVCTKKAAEMLPQFADGGEALRARTETVGDGSRIALGAHTLRFVTAPMVHWPEVAMSYDEATGTLFSADAFGKFGARCHEPQDWDCEARRYYFNIVGKHGHAVSLLLDKAESLDIKRICPLHGPELEGVLTPYVERYRTWSAYEPESRGVFIACCSMHGRTMQAARELAAMLAGRGVATALSDLARDDMHEAVEDAFRYDRMVLCAPSYDGRVMPAMEDFLCHLRAKTYRKRRVALVENFSWAPSAARTMRAYLAELQDIDVVEPAVSIRTRLDDASRRALARLADALAGTGEGKD